MGHKLYISGSFCIAAAFALFLVPIQWCAGAFLAALVHELSHIAAIYLLGERILDIRIAMFGSIIETKPMKQGREVVCAAFGPFGSVIFAAVFSFFPEAALCALVQGLFNLLPVYPLDGGRILHCLLPKAVYIGIEIFTLIMLLGLGIWLSAALRLGILPLIPCFSAVFRVYHRKISCKESNLAVQ